MKTLTQKQRIEEMAEQSVLVTAKISCEDPNCNKRDEIMCDDEYEAAAVFFKRGWRYKITKNGSYTFQKTVCPTHAKIPIPIK